MGRISESIANYLDAMAESMRPRDSGAALIMQAVACGRLCHEDALSIQYYEPRFIDMVAACIGADTKEVLPLARAGKLRIVIENLEESK